MRKKERLYKFPKYSKRYWSFVSSWQWGVQALCQRAQCSNSCSMQLWYELVILHLMFYLFSKYVLTMCLVNFAI